MNSMNSSERAENIATSLLRWYDENKRDLPWRREREPYAVWICEIMAQQTRIAALLPYYEEFMQKFPTIRSLAEASGDDVLKAWEGLGYYARARNLQKAAQKIVADFGGQLPRTKRELLTLPGVGEYTAGAILSIAYDVPVPAVDGNVLRVYSRLENTDEDVLSPATKKHATDFVAALMSPDQASCFTQALIEFGALVCRPKNPDCAVCPLSALCLARACGRERELPKKSAKKPPKVFNKTVLIIRGGDGQILMRRRTETLLSGLWELYLLDAHMVQPELEVYLRAMGFTVNSVRDIGTAKHVFTHQVWRMRGYDCTVSGDFAPPGYQWVEKGEVRNLAIPTAIRFYTEQV